MWLWNFVLEIPKFIPKIRDSIKNSNIPKLFDPEGSLKNNSVFPEENPFDALQLLLNYTTSVTWTNKDPRLELPIRSLSIWIEAFAYFAVGKVKSNSCAFAIIVNNRSRKTHANMLSPRFLKNLYANISFPTI